MDSGTDTDVEDKKNGFWVPSITQTCSIQLLSIHGTKSDTARGMKREKDEVRLKNASYAMCLLHKFPNTQLWKLSLIIIHSILKNYMEKYNLEILQYHILWQNLGWITLFEKVMCNMDHSEARKCNLKFS